ncbi:hypothetical protein B0H19DRAFT_1168212 [Mycena capillaripes]|nr:hypothetical protein B0H19DRAFT_1168212 [Mycena capillaripes]
MLPSLRLAWYSVLLRSRELPNDAHSPLTSHVANLHVQFGPPARASGNTSFANKARLP